MKPLNAILMPAFLLLLAMAPDSVHGQVPSLGEAMQAAEEGDGRKAVELLAKMIDAGDAPATAHYWRGRENFRLGRIDAAVADFNRYVELEPKLESRQWERGIALYYAGKFDLGAKQFELYQTYHDQDVENSAWRFLCTAREKDLDTARRTLLPIDDDPRVPMMKIYDLFAGRASPDDVFTAVEAGSPGAEARNVRLFYANLYVGLYYEVAGKPEDAKKHITAAADRHRIGHYMWDVARVHADRLRNEATKSKSKDAP